MSTLPIKDDPRMRAAIEESLQRGEHGIAVAAYHRGKLVVDAFGGVANPKTKQAVDEKTIFPIFSVTKGITALAVHIQAARGLLEVNAPIAQYWPEFGANGKETITITHVLSHRAGIPQMPKDVTPELLANWDWMVAQIQGHTPLFPPGTTNAYHVLVWGWILGEVVRRTDPSKRSFDVFVQEEICTPLGVKDYYLGVPDSELGRVAVLSGGNSGPLVDEDGISPSGVYPGSDVHNQRVMLQALDPGAGAVATAGSVARILHCWPKEARLTEFNYCPRSGSRNSLSHGRMHMLQTKSSPYRHGLEHPDIIWAASLVRLPLLWGLTETSYTAPALEAHTLGPTFGIGLQFAFATTIWTPA